MDLVTIPTLNVDLHKKHTYVAKTHVFTYQNFFRPVHAQKSLQGLKDILL